MPLILSSQDDGEFQFVTANEPLDCDQIKYANIVKNHGYVSNVVLCENDERSSGSELSKQIRLGLDSLWNNRKLDKDPSKLQASNKQLERSNNTFVTNKIPTNENSITVETRFASSPTTDLHSHDVILNGPISRTHDTSKVTFSTEVSQLQEPLSIAEEFSQLEGCELPINSVPFSHSEPELSEPTSCTAISKENESSLTFSNIKDVLSSLDLTFSESDESNADQYNGEYFVNESIHPINTIYEEEEPVTEEKTGYESLQTTPPISPIKIMINDFDMELNSIEQKNQPDIGTFSLIIEDEAEEFQSPMNLAFQKKYLRDVAKANQQKDTGRTTIQPQNQNIITNDINNNEVAVSRNVDNNISRNAQNQIENVGAPKQIANEKPSRDAVLTKDASIVKSKNVLNEILAEPSQQTKHQQKTSKCKKVTRIVAKVAITAKNDKKTVVADDTSSTKDSNFDNGVAIATLVKEYLRSPLKPSSKHQYFSPSPLENIDDEENDKLIESSPNLFKFRMLSLKVKRNMDEDKEQTTNSCVKSNIAQTLNFDSEIEEVKISIDSPNTKSEDEVVGKLTKQPIIGIVDVNQNVIGHDIHCKKNKTGSLTDDENKAIIFSENGEDFHFSKDISLHKHVIADSCVDEKWNVIQPTAREVETAKLILEDENLSSEVEKPSRSSLDFEDRSDVVSHGVLDLKISFQSNEKYQKTFDCSLPSERFSARTESIHDRLEIVAVDVHSLEPASTPSNNLTINMELMGNKPTVSIEDEIVIPPHNMNTTLKLTNTVEPIDDELMISVENEEKSYKKPTVNSKQIPKDFDTDKNITPEVNQQEKVQSSLKVTNNFINNDDMYVNGHFSDIIRTDLTISCQEVLEKVVSKRKDKVRDGKTEINTNSLQYVHCVTPMEESKDSNNTFDIKPKTSNHKNHLVEFDFGTI